MPRRGRVPIHGHSRSNENRPSRTYESWRGMRYRVRAAPKPCYTGLDMDPRWHDFRCFLLDMGERPRDKTLDRVDGKRGYWPDNCRWATSQEQNLNRSSCYGKRT